MSRQFTASILLESARALDVDRLAEAVMARFPAIGAVDGVPGQKGAQSGVLAMDGTSVVVQAVARRVTPDTLTPPREVLRMWDPLGAVNGHRAHVTISCGGRLPGLEGAARYAAAVHLAAAGVTDIATASAVLWQNSWALSTPDGFRASGEPILQRRFPLAIWVSFAPFTPAGFTPDAATGMATLGLKDFLGRELELAPRPGDAMGAHKIVATVARQVLETGLTLRDGDLLEDGETGLRLTVRKRDCWFKRDLSAFVLVADDTVVDRQTLKPSNASAA